MPPVAYPTVTIGGETFTLKYGFLAEYKISEWGLEIGTVLKCLSPTNTDPRRVSYIFQLFAACVAHNFIDRKEPAPSPEEWAGRIEKAEPDDAKRALALQQIGAGVVAAIVKRLPVPNPTQGTPANDPGLKN